MLLGITGCWDDEIVDAGAPRPQVENLKAVPGDEETLLTWTMPDGWNPTDFMITYKTPDSETVTMRTGSRVNEYTVGDLINDYQYSFDVQAVYGDLISGAVTAIAKPSTSRFPVTDLVAIGDNETVTLTWTCPSMLVRDYTLTYFPDSNPTDTKEITIASDMETVAVTGLTNDIIYTFQMVANYDRGQSSTTTVKAMPTLAIPYFVSTSESAVGLPVHFTFNRADYANAANVTWTFPGNIVKTGDEVDYAFTSKGTQSVTLSILMDNNQRSWTFDIEVREYVVWSTDWTMDGTTFNGFKGSCPVFSPDGATVYDITFNKITTLYAFDTATGNERWRFTPAQKASSYNMLTVNPVNGDIYFGTTTAGQFYCVSSDGNQRWQFTEAGSMQAAAPAVNASGTVVYISDNGGNTFAIDASTGTKLWNVALGAAGAAILVNGDEIIVGTTTKGIFFLNAATGAQIATLKTSKNITDISGFAVASDKRTVYIPNNGGALSVIDIIDHTIVIDSKVADADSPNNMYEPVIAPNGDVFVGSKDSHVYCFDKDLNQKWKYKAVDANNAFNFSHPCVDTEGNFYITSGQVLNVCYIFSPTGTVISTQSFGSNASSDKQMGGNNLLKGMFYSALVGAAGSNGIFVGIGVGYDRASTWSTHGGDPCGSCCIK